MPHEEKPQAPARWHSLSLEGREKLGITGVEDVSGFDDGGSISPYAHHGVAYCNANGVMTGIGGTKTFAPQAIATRCQMAKVIAVTDKLRAAQ